MRRALHSLLVLNKALRSLLVLVATLAVLTAGLAGVSAQRNTAPNFSREPKHLDYLPTSLIVGDNQTLVGPAFKAPDRDAGNTTTYSLSDTTSGSGHAAKFSIAQSATDSTRYQISRLTDTPAGNYQVTVTVADDRGGTAIREVNIAVTSGTSWEQQRKLIAAISQSVNCDPNSRFGYKVAATDEIIVVGAPRADRTPDCMTDGSGPTDNKDEGAVYVFDRATGNQLAKLTSPNPISTQANSLVLSSEDVQGFGYSVAVDGDTIVVGAPHETSSSSSPGSSGNTWLGYVYIFEKPGNGWANTSSANSTISYTPDSHAAGNVRSYFGYAVDIKGDTLVVTTNPDRTDSPTEAQLAEAVGQSAGIYVFDKPDDGWADTATDASSVVKLLPGSDFKHGGTAQNQRRPIVRGFHSVAISADESTIAVGVPLHHADRRTMAASGLTYNPSERLGSLIHPQDTRNNFGWVYVFEKPSSGSWATVPENTKVPRLAATNREVNASMGYDVAISNNGDTIVAGSSLANNNLREGITNLSGVAYVFTRPADGWADKESDAQLSTTAAHSGNLIGYAVDIVGSGNRIAVSQDSSQGSGYRGAALIFDKPDDGWADTNTPDFTLTAADSAADDTFGGDVHFADETTVVIGQDGHAHGHFVNRGATTSDTARFGTSSGGVYLFQDTAPRFATNPRHIDFLPSRLIVGDNQTSVGPAFKATDTGTSGALTYALLDTTTGSGDAAKFSIAATADDATRFQISRSANTLAADYAVTVTATDSDGYTATKNITITVTSGGSWSQSTQPGKMVAKLSPTVLCDPNSRFGYQVTATAEIIVVGAPRADRTPDCMLDGDGPTDNRDEGAVYVFDRTTGEQLAKLTSPFPVSAQTGFELSEEDVQGFGYSVAADGDTIVVGAPHEREETANESWRGYVTVFVKPTEGWADSSTPTATLIYIPASHANGAARVYFGYAVDIKGNTIAVTTNPTGHPTDQPAHTGNASGVYVFTKSTSNSWNNLRTNLAVRLTPGADFKHLTNTATARRPITNGFTSVAISADERTIAAGVTQHHADQRTMTDSSLPFNPSERLGARLADRSDTQGNFGWVYVFEKPDTGDWATIPETTQVPRLVAKDPVAEGRMGYDIAISDNGDTIIAGAHGQNVSGDPGAAYIFTRPPNGWADKTSDAKLTTTTANSGDLVGYAVDITPSGRRVAVSHDSSQSSGYRGAALIYDQPSNQRWADNDTPTATITAADSKADDTFGGDIHFADHKNLLIGQDAHAHGHFVNRGTTTTNTNRFGTSSGSTYLYQGPAEPTPRPSTGDGGGLPPPPPPPPPPPIPGPMPGQCPEGQTLTFPDVNPKSTHKAGIDCVAALGITAGNTKGEFAPNKAVTRAQMATFLKRLWEKIPGNTCPASKRNFPDVNPKSTHKAGIDCVAALEITAGNVAGNYQPSKAVTRAQMATFLKRLWEKTGQNCPTTTRTFPDVNPESTHKAGIDCVAALEITAGNVAGNYQPSKAVTRAQMATFLSRLWKALPAPAA